MQRNLILTEKGPVAEVIWTWQFRPHTGEPGVLDPVKIPFYNTSTRQLDAVEIPALAIGYASFYTGQVPRGRIQPGQVALLSLLVFAGLALGLGLAALIYRPEATRRGWARLRALYSPRNHWLYWRARREGDALAQRRFAEFLGKSAGERAALERQIYGPPPPRASG